MSRSPPAPSGLGRIGPWRVIRRLGRGGVASVYEVIDPVTGRRAALKLFRDPAHGASLEREYRALAGLDHPGVVRVLGRGESQGRPHLITELVVGRPAQACARQAGMPGSPGRVAVALRVVHDLVEAVGYLHRRGILHRDVKSSNVLADAAGHVKLLDLGTAGYERPGGDGPSAWVPGLERFAGTAAYASLEQLQGRALDARSDLFSVGVLWYRMLTGELPYVATCREHAVLLREQSPPASPHVRVPGVPPEAGELVMELMALRPEERPGGAEQVLARLRPMLVGGGPRPASLWPEPPPLVGRQVLLEQLEGFLDGGEGSLRLLVGAPGLGVHELLHWTGQQARRGGHRVLVVSPDQGPGNLISRLLLAVPRHLRRGLRRIDKGPSAPRVARAAGLLARLDSVLERPLLLLLSELQRCQDAELAELVELMQLVERRGLGVRALGGWEQAEPDGPFPLAELWPDLPRLSLEPLPPRYAALYLRGLTGGRALPPVLEASLAREGGGVPRAVAEALQASVAAGRLRPGRTPEGTSCWLEVLVGLDEPAEAPGERLADLLACSVDDAPWNGSAGLTPSAAGVPLAELLVSAPEEHPEPRIRAVLHAWRGYARGLCGDRDLQADADLFQAEEDLRAALQRGWQPALAWLELVALVRAIQLGSRGRQLEAQRRLADASRAREGAWQRQQRMAALLLLASAEGHASLPDELRQQAWADEVLVAPDLGAARSAWLLQRGRLMEVPVGEPAPASLSDAWSAEPRSRSLASGASSLVLRGQLSAARTLLNQGLELASGQALGPPRAWLLLGLAEAALELFRPGVCREHLADAFVMLRHCDRPELSAGRERLRGRVALACGEPARAEAAFRTGLNMLRGTGFHVATAELQCWLSRALSRLGRRREAASLLAPARARLLEAAAHPALVVACAADWEAGGYREDPQVSYAPVLAWLEREDPLLLRCDLALARLRHGALHSDLRRVGLLRGEAEELLERLLGAQDPDDRAILAMHPRLRMLRRAGR